MASRYAVHEFDCNGVVHKTNQIFILDRNDCYKRYSNFDHKTIVEEFLRQFYPGMIGPSAHYAVFDKDMEVITIHWLKPVWRLDKLPQEEKPSA